MTRHEAFQLCLALSREMAQCPCGTPPSPPLCARCACLVTLISAAMAPYDAAQAVLAQYTPQEEETP